MSFEQPDRIVLDQVLANTTTLGTIAAEITQLIAGQKVQSTAVGVNAGIAMVVQEQQFQATATNQATIISLLNEILNLLTLRPKPVRLFLGFPSFTSKATGAPMPNTLAMLDTQVAHIPIMTQNAEGNVVPAPVGDVDTATSADTSQFVAVVAMDAMGNPEIMVTPMVQVNSAGVQIALTDSAGLTPFDFTVTVSRDTVAATLVGNLGGVTFTAQPEPTTPGPG